jgi:hypothetical protein
MRGAEVEHEQATLYGVGRELPNPGVVTGGRALTLIGGYGSAVYRKMPAACARAVEPGAGSGGRRATTTPLAARCDAGSRSPLPPSCFTLEGCWIAGVAGAARRKAPNSAGRNGALDRNERSTEINLQ